MPRYFYTDPLAAAWMMKHFGMRFTNSQGMALLWDKEFSCFYLPDGLGSEQEWEGKHYIHSESLRLLEPQIDDLVRVDKRLWGEIDDIRGYDEDQYFVIRYHGGWFSCIDKIIQRNGLAFHWPGVES